MLQNFKQGVREFNDALKIPNSSVNLSIVKTDDKSVKVELFARAMDKKSLNAVCEDCETFLKSFGFNAEIKNMSEPWKPVVTPFANIMKKKYEQIF